MRQQRVNGTITIDRHIPLPRVRAGRPATYPWVTMKRGDSFSSPVNSHSMGRAALYASRKTGFKFAVRKQGSGCRVWRIK